MLKIKTALLSGHTKCDVDISVAGLHSSSHLHDYATSVSSVFIIAINDGIFTVVIVFCSAVP